MIKPFLVVILSLVLSACYIPIKTGPTKFSLLPGKEFTRYPPPVRQGVLVTQEKLNNLRIGHTKDQVKYHLGDPHIGLNRPDEFYYVYYYKDSEIQRVVVYFENGKITDIDADNELTWSPILVRNTHLPKTKVVTVPDRR